MLALLGSCRTRAPWWEVLAVWLHSVMSAANAGFPVVERLFWHLGSQQRGPKDSFDTSGWDAFVRIMVKTPWRHVVRRCAVGPTGPGCSRSRASGTQAFSKRVLGLSLVQPLRYIRPLCWMRQPIFPGPVVSRCPTEPIPQGCWLGVVSCSLQNGCIPLLGMLPSCRSARLCLPKWTCLY
jgi:hypothetical protein